MPMNATTIQLPYLTLSWYQCQSKLFHGRMELVQIWRYSRTTLVCGCSFPQITFMEYYREYSSNRLHNYLFWQFLSLIG